MNRQREYPCNVCACAVKMPKNVEVTRVAAAGTPTWINNKRIEIWYWVWTPKSSDIPLRIQCKECRDLIAGKIDWWQVKDDRYPSK